MRQVILILVVGFLGSTSLAQDLLISQATLHVGDGETVIENTDILIADGRIAEIAPRIPTNKMIQVVNANGRHVTPAFFQGSRRAGSPTWRPYRNRLTVDIESFLPDLCTPKLTSGRPTTRFLA